MTRPRRHTRAVARRETVEAAAAFEAGRLAGRDLVLAPFTLVVDSREQLPYDFTGLARTTVAALPAGDYSIVGHERRFSVERKSLSDAYGTFSRGRERFERELQKLAGYDLAVILIEASLDDCLAPPPHVQHVKPGTVINSLLSWLVDHRVVPIFGSRDRDRARAIVFRLAERYWRRAQASASTPSTPPEAA